MRRPTTAPAMPAGMMSDVGDSRPRTSRYSVCVASNIAISERNRIPAIVRRYNARRERVLTVLESDASRNVRTRLRNASVAGIDQQTFQTKGKVTTYITRMQTCWEASATRNRSRGTGLPEEAYTKLWRYHRTLCLLRSQTRGAQGS